MHDFICSVSFTAMLEGIIKKTHAVHSLLKDLDKSLFLLVIKKIFLNQNLCAPPNDHHVFFTESVKGVGEVEDAIIDVIYINKN